MNEYPDFGFSFAVDPFHWIWSGKPLCNKKGLVQPTPSEFELRLQKEIQMSKKKLSTRIVKYRRLMQFFKVFLSLVMLVLEILKRIKEF